MPVSTTLGALTYAKTTLDDDYQYWYLQLTNITEDTGNTSSNISTKAIARDNNANIYVGGYYVNNFSYEKYLLIKLVDNGGNAYLIPQFNSVSTDLGAGNPGSILELQGAKGTANATRIMISGTFSNSGNSTMLGTMLSVGNNGFAINGGNNRQTVNLSSTPFLLNGWCFNHVTDLPGNARYLLYTDTDGPSEVGRTVNLTSNANQNIFGNLNFFTSENNICTYDKYFIQFGNSRATNYPIGWQKEISDNSRIVSDLANSNSNNITFVTSSGVLGKLDTTGNLVWAKQVGNINFTGIQDNGNTIITTGRNSNNIYIGKYDSNGNNIWQTEFAGKTFSTYAVIESANNVYVVSDTSNNGVIIKLPNDGSIPGNGNYTGNLTYFTSNVSISNSNVSVSNSNLSSNTFNFAPVDYTYPITDTVSCARTLIGLV